ncbi:MAG: DUF2000 domain-containing protein [Bacilli bacterium]|nr:DUF2000 domain-containing protein [Bacilli bacterium]
MEKIVYNETYKFVAVINKDIEMGKALNAIAHSCAGLVSMAPDDIKEKMSFIDFVDKDDSVHKSISGLSLIVLRAKNGELKKLRRNLIEHNLLFTDFTETMTGDTYREQLDKTRDTGDEDMKYYCIATFGEKEILDPLTRKFSLWH